MPPKLIRKEKHLDDYMIQTPITEMECVHFETTKQPLQRTSGMEMAVEV